MTAVGLASFARLPREGAVGAVLTYVRAIRTGRAATTVAAGPAVTDQPAVTTGTALAAVRASHGGVGAVTALAAVATTVHGSAGRAGHTLGGAGAAGATLPTGAWVTTIAAGPTVTILESHVAAATAAPVTGAPIGVVLLLLALGLEFSATEFASSLRHHLPSAGGGADCWRTRSQKTPDPGPKATTRHRWAHR